MQCKAMYYGEQNHVGIGYVLKNMMTILLVVLVMYHFIMKG